MDPNSNNGSSNQGYDRFNMSHLQGPLSHMMWSVPSTTSSLPARYPPLPGNNAFASPGPSLGWPTMNPSVPDVGNNYGKAPPMGSMQTPNAAVVAAVAAAAANGGYGHPAHHQRHHHQNNQAVAAAAAAAAAAANFGRHITSKPNPEARYQHLPATKVLHLRNLPSNATRQSLQEMCQVNGVTFVEGLVLTGRSQGFLELSSIEEAEVLLGLSSAGKLQVAGKFVYAHYSGRQAVSVQEHREARPGRVLYVTVEDRLDGCWPVPMESFIAVFSSLGRVQRIILTREHALVEMDSKQSALGAMDKLQGKYLYSIPQTNPMTGVTTYTGACRLIIEFSYLEELTIEANNEKMLDLTKTNKTTVPATSPSPAIPAIPAVASTASSASPLTPDVITSSSTSPQVSSSTPGVTAALPSVIAAKAAEQIGALSNGSSDRGSSMSAGLEPTAL